MGFNKCKKSVFCILFLIWFLIGTICGFFLFRCLQKAHGGWAAAYCAALTGTDGQSLLSFLFFACRPLLLAGLLCLLPWGRRLVPVLTAARGCLMAYYMAFFFAASLSPLSMALREAVILPPFFCLCRLAYQGPAFSADASAPS